MTDAPTLDLAEIKRLAEAATPGEWQAGHLSDDEAKCNCPYIFDECHAGAIAEVYVDNGKLIADGGNDCPALEEAKANLRFIVAVQPRRIVALLSRLDAAEQECDRLRTACEGLACALGAVVEPFNGFSPGEITRRYRLDMPGTPSATSIIVALAVLAAYRATPATEAPAP